MVFEKKTLYARLGKELSLRHLKNDRLRELGAYQWLILRFFQNFEATPKTQKHKRGIMPINIALNRGWFGGSSISGSDVNSIKEVISINNAANVGDISSVWGRIKDWFFGTNKEDAKRELFKLMSPTVALDEKIKAFENLKSMVGDGCKGYFTHEAINGVDTFKINCSANPEDSIFELTFKTESYNDDECSEVSKALNEDIKDKGADIREQFRKDCSRSKYLLDGKEIDGKGLLTHEKFKNSPAKLMCLCQTLFGVAQNFLFKKNNVHFEVPGVGGNYKVQYEIREKKDEIGAVSVKATLEKDISAAHKDEFFGNYLELVSQEGVSSQKLVSSQKVEINIEFEKIDDKEVVAIKNIIQRTS